ncbi:MAG: hydroxyacid dehydrogenase, partial [Actinomycetota bacterium]|nr:hydroxyacid dehydrogenase [Actinomycetota bacterium]
MKILICDKLDTLAIEELEKLGNCIDVSNEKNKLEKIKENIVDAEVVLVRSDTQINKELIGISENLKIIGRSGVGTDNIDLEEASKRNIQVTNTPEANVISAAELTVGLIISAARNITVANNSVKKSEWERSEFIGIELYKKRLGLIGFGKVAKLVSTRMQSFNMDVVFYDPFIDSSTDKEKKVELDELLNTSDFVSIHIPKNKETENLISKEKLSLMKKGSVIINTSRGGLIDQQEVFNLVNENKLYSAGFDVYEIEPPEISKEYENSKIITLPHLGASTKEAQIRAGEQLIKNIKEILNNDFSSVV